MGPYRPTAPGVPGLPLSQPELTPAAFRALGTYPGLDPPERTPGSPGRQPPCGVLIILALSSQAGQLVMPVRRFHGATSMKSRCLSTLSLFMGCLPLEGTVQAI